MSRLVGLLAAPLALLPRDVLDGAYGKARDLQRREEDGWFKNKKGRWQMCRLAATDWDDPIMAMSGCSGEFASDFRKRDVRDGCPFCRGEVKENASEPDVMARWGLRR
jgi:hypothetical protein